MDLRQVLQILTAVLATLLVVLVMVITIYLLKKRKKNNEGKKEEKIKESTDDKYTVNMSDKESIFKFMEFDSIEDNMIVQKNGSRYVMVIECKGVNYDLLSSLEKTSVEEGFIQFLNTLRSSIQIYMQTRTVNLEKSIQAYNERVRTIEDKLNRMILRYKDMQESGESPERLNKAYLEITKLTNMYEYGKDIIRDTKRMSLNKNILNKKYYIVISYFSEEANNPDMDREEKRNAAFAELYTRSQSIIKALSACEVEGRILRTNELMELLYMTYNRDEAEVLGLESALRSGYDSMYATAPEVLNKKMKELDNMIQEKAIEKAKEKVAEVKSELQEAVETKEASLDDLINQMAKAILEDNTVYLGKDVTDKAIEKVEEEEKEQERKKEEARKKEESKVKRIKKTVRVSKEKIQKTADENVVETEEGGE